MLQGDAPARFVAGSSKPALPVRADEALRTCVVGRESFREMAEGYRADGMPEIARIYAKLAAVMGDGAQQMVKIVRGMEDAG